MTPAEIKAALLKSGCLFPYLGVKNHQGGTSLSDLGAAPPEGTKERDEWEMTAVRLGLLCRACGSETKDKVCTSCKLLAVEYYVEPEPWAVALLALLDEQPEPWAVELLALLDEQPELQRRLRQWEKDYDRPTRRYDTDPALHPDNRYPNNRMGL